MAKIYDFTAVAFIDIQMLSSGNSIVYSVYQYGVELLSNIVLSHWTYDSARWIYWWVMDFPNKGLVMQNKSPYGDIIKITAS